VCLSIPSQVVRIEQDIAWVDTLGMQRHASLALMGDEVKLGDYVLIHVGFVMNVMDAEDAQQSLALYQQMLEQDNGGVDIEHDDAEHDDAERVDTASAHRLDRGSV